MDEIRRKRVEEQLRDVVASLIMGGSVKDPRVGPFVSVTRVEAASDLSTAKIFVSTFATPDGEPELQAKSLDLAVEGLKSASGYIQNQVAKRMKTRLTPRLHFIADKGIKEGFELNERMKGLFS